NFKIRPMQRAGPPFKRGLGFLAPTFLGKFLSNGEGLAVFMANLPWQRRKVQKEFWAQNDRVPDC
ncbi:MAG: hypothetical protein AB1441_04065, partial [Bacillota bacterium]